MKSTLNNRINPELIGNGVGKTKPLFTKKGRLVFCFQL
ncbi:hypothetical protein PALB_18730 [Pseudoalteromonas luteoviolacea B = ATCC 29581]|nr:hypothetical protein PALB_18730 [Pseudoalteromonas luteoviolacea B = ATCC 29581]